MSKHDYSKIAKREETKPIDNAVPEDIRNEVIDAIEDSISNIGIVIDCVKLNIRRYPKKESYVLCEVPVLTELRIDSDRSTDEWLSVCTAAGIEGFCMTKYVKF